MLVAYFTHSGNTRTVADRIAQAAGVELFRIEAAHAYPTDYDAVVEVARDELRKGLHPALRGTLPDLSVHEVLILGFPNWWATMPMPVFTFLKGLNLEGKTILPFCTHEGSGMGRSVSDIRKLCPGAKVLEGLAIRGSGVGMAASAVEEWIARVGLLPGLAR
jgi:flavodoxin